MRKSESAKTYWPKTTERDNSQQGQFVVEYVLLLVISVTIAALLTTNLVSRSMSEGIITTAWHNMLNYIGHDDAGGKDPLK